MKYFKFIIEFTKKAVLSVKRNYTFA